MTPPHAIARWTDSALLLGKDKHAWSRLPGIEAVSRVSRHRVPVVSDQNSVLLSREFKERWISRSSQSGSLHIKDVNGRLMDTQTWMMSASMSSSARKRTITCASNPSLSALLASGQTARDSIGSAAARIVRRRNVVTRRSASVIIQSVFSPLLLITSQLGVPPTLRFPGVASIFWNLSLLCPSEKRRPGAGACFGLPSCIGLETLRAGARSHRLLRHGQNHLRHRLRN